MPVANTGSPRSTPRSSRPWVPLAVLAVLAVGLVVVMAGRGKTTSPVRKSGGVLAVGASAPAVALPSTTGATTDLGSLRGKRNVLLYFYEHAG